MQYLHGAYDYTPGFFQASYKRSKPAGELVYPLVANKISISHIPDVMPKTTESKRAPHESPYEAAASGDLEAVKTLLNNGADINAVDSPGSSRLHAAAKKVH